jgi:hypothetical protein
MGQRLHPATADSGLGRREAQEERPFLFRDVVLHEDGYAVVVRELLLVGQTCTRCKTRAFALLRIELYATVCAPFRARTTRSGLVMKYHLQVLGIALTLAAYESTLTTSRLQSIALWQVRRIESGTTCKERRIHTPILCCRQL